MTPSQFYQVGSLFRRADQPYGQLWTGRGQNVLSACIGWCLEARSNANCQHCAISRKAHRARDRFIRGADGYLEFFNNPECRAILARCSVFPVRSVLAVLATTSKRDTERYGRNGSCKSIHKKPPKKRFILTARRTPSRPVKEAS